MSSAGRTLRALPGMLRVGLAAAVAYRGEFLIWVLTTNMPLVMLLLWTAVAREAPVGRFGEGEFRTYFLVALLVRLLTGSWVVWELTMEVRQGTLAQRLLRPVHPFVSYAADNLAALPMRVALATPIALAALAWAGTGHLSRDPVLWVAVPAALAGAWVLSFFVMAAVGSLALFWESSLALFDLWLGLVYVLSGYTVPLELLPPRLLVVVRWLPFRFLLSFPVELATGSLSRGGALAGLCVQWAYAGAAVALSLAVWKAGLRRFAAYGG